MVLPPRWALPAEGSERYTIHGWERERTFLDLFVTLSSCVAYILSDPGSWWQNSDHRRVVDISIRIHGEVAAKVSLSFSQGWHQEWV